MTYSIVARDAATGMLGVAVQSHYFSVGSVVTWARAGVGAVATQSFVELSYGPLGLELMGAGKSAQEALQSLLESDRYGERRQIAMVDSKGNIAVHTGEGCIPYAGHAVGIGFSAQANLMANDTVWGSMKDSFERNADLEFPERLASSLMAAEAAGGDIRGSQSAAILVVGPDVAPHSWMGRVLELRVEDHPKPVEELTRLIRMHRAYELADKAETLLHDGKYDESSKLYQQATEYAQLDELNYWRALSLLKAGKKEDAEAILEQVYSKAPNWKRLTELLKRSGRLGD
jgi:uncharacterized Ntn-hydrolase superfamily protein